MSTVWELLKRLGVGTWRGIVLVGTLIFVVLPMIGIFVMPLLRGCSDSTLTWQEEVKLLDGRVITVTQKRRCEDDIPREAWVTFKLPEFGDKEIVWHENLEIRVLNVYERRLYIVGAPYTEREFRQYGSPKPSYVGYRYDSGQWVYITFNEIPLAIYDSNMYFENMALFKLKHVSLQHKEELMKDDRYVQYLKRIDPKHVSINY